MGARIILLLWAACAIAACAKKPTAAPHPPSPVFALGVASDGWRYTFFKWKAGLALLIVEKSDALHKVGPAHGETWRYVGHWKERNRGSNEGIEYKWDFATSDGRSATFKVSNVEYDLTKGTVFQIEPQDGKINVRQIAQDISRLPNDAIEDYISASPELGVIPRKSKLH